MTTKIRILESCTTVLVLEEGLLSSCFDQQVEKLELGSQGQIDPMERHISHVWQTIAESPLDLCAPLPWKLRTKQLLVVSDEK